MTIPNLLTVLRFSLIPAFAYAYLVLDMRAAYISIFIISGITDVLDGYIARHFQQTSDWGAAFDPIADKATNLVTMFCIAMGGVRLMWLAFGVLCVKELFMVLGGVRLYKKRDIVLSSSWYGKASTVFSFVAMLVIMWGNGSISMYIINGMILTALCLSVFSGVMYTLTYKKLVKRQTLDDNAQRLAE